MSLKEQLSTLKSEETVVDDSEVLQKLKNGEVLNYNGLTFDTKKLKKARNKGLLSGFNFVINNNETGISFQVPQGLFSRAKNFFSSDKEQNNNFLIIIPPKDLENCINFTLAKDNNKDTTQNIPQKTIMPENPHEWKYKSKLPQLLVETPEGRRAMTRSEANIAFDKVLDIVFEMDKHGIIDIRKTIGAYETKYGIKKWTGPIKKLPNWALKNLIKSRVNGGNIYDNLEGRENAALIEFETEKQKAIEHYDEKKKIERLEQAEKEKQKLAEEQHRKDSLIHIKGKNFKPVIEQDNLNTLLSFEEEKNYISITYTKGTNNLTGTIGLFDKNGQHIKTKNIEPQEWRDISNVLNQKLTQEQKKQLGNDFLKTISNKSGNNLQLLSIKNGRE